jgi:DNA polymerase III delta subunit
VLSAIEKGGVDSVYLLLGEDSLAARSIIDALKLDLLSPGLEAFDFEDYQADELNTENLNPEVIGQHLRQPPVASKRRLIVVRGITREGRNGAKLCALQAAGVERLLTLVRNTPDSATIAVTGVRHQALSRIVARLRLRPAVVDLKPPKEGDLSALVQKMAKQAGINLTADAARLLVNISGLDPALLQTEVEKLATATGKGQRVTPAGIRKLAGSSRSYRLWEYTDRVSRRDASGAMGVLRGLEEWDESPSRIVVWLTGMLIDLVAAKAGVLPSNLRWRVRHSESTWNDARELNRCLQQLYRINRSFLTGQPETWARFEAFTSCIACTGRSGYCDTYADGEEHELCMVRAPRRRKSPSHSRRMNIV